MIQNIHALCEECDEAITNPICPDCLERQALAWLMERRQNLLIMKVKERLNSIKKYSESNESEVNCIICKNKLSICPHCTSKELLKVFNKEKRLLRDFMTVFNYLY